MAFNNHRGLSLTSSQRQLRSTGYHKDSPITLCSSNTNQTILIVCVDYTILTGDNEKEMDGLKTILAKQFKIKSYEIFPWHGDSPNQEGNFRFST